jgi:DNA-binding NarL/FixJ family response regulator
MNDKESGPRILIVEDEYLVALQSEISLREYGFEVVGIAASADEAVRLAQSERPALVVMDVRLMGARDGVDAALEIFKTSGIRSLFVTAHYDDETKKRAEAAQPLGWLAKPYTPTNLVALARYAAAELDKGR